MFKRTLIGVISFVATTALVPLSAASASSPAAPFVVNHATATASSIKGSSALTLVITNTGHTPISFMTISSTTAKMGMYYYDANMCQGNNMMVWLPNIFLSAHSSVTLGYRYQGAMLTQLRTPLRVGATVPVRLTWSNYVTTGTTTINVTVVAPPKGLHFLMSTMRM